MSQTYKYDCLFSHQVFKNARVIGATVVGAARRLEAIRNAEPFAVVVEEACEVMEPTLMAVLAVRSLRKLQLVGDHRQLPAFIQNYWFNLEVSHPSIKTSLFERLITSNANRQNKQRELGSRVPWSVLDEQWRMRPMISNLTRPHYADVVKIIDHARTSAQKVGDRLKGFSTDLGNHPLRVPGVIPSIYFWDIQGNHESRPEAGLSACNATEAECVVRLINWLQHCGVPESSISVITPYKGQRMKIFKSLPRGTGITVSTVDRYQGDENDIVILSIVRTKPGNRFVALKNRFIVAMSRARIGFYIIGSSAAVSAERQDKSDKLAHWSGLLEHLQLPQTELEIEQFGSRGLGSELLVCCPRHSDVTKRVIKAVDFPDTKNYASFCNKPCEHVLPCGHSCGLPCHSPAVFHNVKCDELVANPCNDHRDVMFSCHVVQSVKYECQVNVFFTRDCGDALETTCAVQKSYKSGLKKQPLCVVKKDDFHLPCGHRISRLPCHERRAFEKLLPTCSIVVDHTSPCGCKKKMSCHEKQREIANPSICTLSVNIDRPRCSHRLSVPCTIAQQILEKWRHSVHESAPRREHETVVIHGQRYGPAETTYIPSIPMCTVNVAYQGPCQHEIDCPCYTAFEFASGQKKSPECKVSIPKSLPCGHNKSAPCNLPIERVTCDALVSSKYVYKCGNQDHSIPAKTCANLQQLRNSNPECPFEVECQRYRCGHNVKVHCNQRQLVERFALGNKLPDNQTVVEGVHYCEGEDGAQDCNQPISYQRSCGHTMQKIPCANAFQWANGIVQQPQCKQLDLFLSPLCSHIIEIECWALGEIDRWKPWVNRQSDKFVTVVDPISQEPSRLLVVREEHRPESLHPPNVSETMLQCDELVHFVRVCGHEVKTRCSSVWSMSKCMEEVFVECERCGYNVGCTCNEYRSANVGSRRCLTSISQPCSTCNINLVTFPCWALKGECDNEVSATLACGHEVTWKCGTDDPRDEAPPMGCRKCVEAAWIYHLQRYTDMCDLKNAAKLESMVQVIRASCDSLISRDFEFKEANLVELKVKYIRDHITARMSLLKNVLESMRKDHVPLQLPPPFIDEPGDVNQYDLVFRSTEPSRGNSDPGFLFTQSSATVYGLGGQFMRFTVKNLQQFAGTDTEAKVILGMAFRHRVRMGAEPFRSVESKSTKARQVANLAAEKVKRLGYDSVDVIATANGTVERVYWNAAVAFPLSIVTVSLKQVCCICYGGYLLAEVVGCGNVDDKHFICENCICQFAETAIAADGSQRVVDEQQEMLRCPSDNCTALLPKNAASEVINEAIVKVRIVLHERRVLPAALAAERERITADMRAALEARSSSERNAHLLRMQIVNDILTLKCPRCKAAFIDFEGCFALTCENRSCNAAFCAWCLFDCGSDAHSHVAHCPEGNGRYHGSFDAFEAHHRRRKQTKVRERLTQENDSDVRRMVLDLLRKDLEHSGIPLNSVVK
jgi:hypothetical protein